MMADEQPPLRIRPDLGDSVSHDPPLDRLLRRQPRKVSVFTLLRAIPGLHGRFSDIPESFWALDVNDAGYSEAVVACPCGRSPRVELGTVRQCPCERFFAFLGARVMVANSPVRELQARPIAADEVAAPPGA
jgi:hypothetical protein